MFRHETSQNLIDSEILVKIFSDMIHTHTHIQDLQWAWLMKLYLADKDNKDNKD